MTTCNAVKKLALGVVLSGLFAWQANAVLVYTSTTTLGNQGATGVNGPWALGLDFTVNTPGYVTQIGVFDSLDNGVGFGSAVIPVAIYNLSTGLIVPGTSLSFTGTDGTPGGGSYRLLPVTGGTGPGGTVYLAPGSYSIVAANYGSPTSSREQDYNAYVGAGVAWPNPSFVNPIQFNTVNNALTTGPGRFVNGFTSLTLPPGQSSYYQPLFGSATFDFTPVPEAAGFALAGVGLLGLVYIGRCYRFKLKLA